MVVLLHLLPWAYLGVDILEDGLEGAVVTNAQVLDLNLPLVGPSLWHLRRRCSRTKERERER